MSRLGPAAESALSTLGVVVAVAILLSAFTVMPASRPTSGGSTGQTVTTTDNLDDGDVSAPEDGPVASSGPLAESGDQRPTGDARGQDNGGSTDDPAPGPVQSGGAPPADGQKFECVAGGNGGGTDVGVTGDTIRLAATIVDDGPGASFLAPVRIGMTAVTNKVNREGGICGRQVELILRNDSWDATLGAQFIQRFVEQEKVFALAVVPSSEGLRSADQYIEEQQVPVVGTDGMLIHQYTNPWIWPVATSTISTMHIMAKEAFDRGAERFGLVFDARYHFGVEGAYAFNQAVKRLTGSDIDGFDPSLKSCQLAFCGIQPDRPSYATEAQSFDQACYGMEACDFVAYLLEPDTAVDFIHAEARSADPSHGFGLAQPLFNRRFAEACKSICDGMKVWTGYVPPIEKFASQPPAVDYVDTIRRESATADTANQFLEGGYVGMNLMMEALRKTGPHLTRERLAATLDSMTFDLGLSKPLTWRPGQHFANQHAMAFEITYQQSFNGWRQATEFLADPWVGQDIPPDGE